MTETNFTTTWSSSSGSRAPRSRDAIMALHRLHFVDKKGMEGVSEMIEARRAENCKTDRHMEREHKRRIQSLHDEMDHKLKNCLKFGSTSIWTKEERDHIEERRQDPDEAREKMTKHMRELGKSYRQEKGAMTERVNAKPLMNVRSKEEWAQIEEARQDPEEAKQAMTQHLQELSTRFKEEKAAMMARVQASPRQTFRTKEQKAKIEELRQDPDEAREKMEKHSTQLQQSWKEEVGSMTQKVKALPAISLWTPAQRAAIEEARQDPDEAKTKMVSHMHELERTARENKRGMMERVKQTPRKTFWTPEERRAIEDVRTDPEEAKQKAALDMKEVARQYRDQRREINERVNAYPRTTFESPEVRARRRYAEELRLSQSLKKP